MDNPKQSIRTKYFSLLGQDKNSSLGSSSEERLVAALKFLQEELPDFDSAIMLFDKREDIENSGWLLLMSVLLSNDIKSRRFNPEAAKILFQKAFQGRNDQNSLSFRDEEILMAIPGIDSVHKALDKEFITSPVDEDLEIFRRDDLYIKNLMAAIIDVQIIRKQIRTRYGFERNSDFFDYYSGSTEINTFGDISSREDFSQEKKHEGYVSFHEPWEAYTSSSMINAIARSISWTENYFYNPEVAERLYTYSAVKFPEYESNNCGAASFRLGFHHGSGYTGRVDHNASVFWFEIAKKLGQGMAPLQAYNILLDNDERAVLDDEAFRHRMDGLLQAVEDLGQKCANHALVKRHAYGAGKWNDQEKVYKNYESIIDDDFWAPPQLSALYAYALRSYIFKDVELMPQDILFRLTANSNEHKAFYNAELLIPVNNFQEILDRNGDIEYQKTQDKITFLIKGLYRNEFDYTHFIDKLEEIISNPDENKMAIRDAFWAADQLASQEGWYLSPWIDREYERANINYLELDLTTMIKSALIMGPFYNPIDPTNGLPILGQHLPASETQEDTEAHRIKYGFYTPQIGIGSLKSVHGEPDGSITFKCETSDPSPAMLMTEDFDVVMALAFGSPARPIWPALSLEREVPDLLDDKYEMFKAKIWDPEWLGHTDFGRTLYIVDRLTGQMTWSPKSYPVSEPENSFDPKFPEYVKTFLEDLRFTGGADRITQSKLINVSPEHIPVPITKEILSDGTERWNIEITEIKMRVNGAYTQKIDGVENRKISWNDTMFAQGRLTQRLTDHYNDIALMMPVFERAKQMMALLYSVIELREKGFTPSPDVLGNAQTTLKYYQSLPPLKREELVMKSHPFRIDFNF